MLKQKYTFIITYLGLLLIGVPTQGQDLKDTLQYKVDLNFTGRKISGTFDQLVAGGGVNLGLRYKNWHLENKTTYRYNDTNTRLIEDNWYDLAILKYYPKGNKKIFPGVFYHFDNSLVYRVNGRHQYGVGLGSELNKGKMKLSLMSAVANEKTTFNGSEFVNSDLDFAKRNNGLFLFKLNNSYGLFNNKINLSYQLFYFQSLKESSDYDIWLTSRISFKIVNDLSIQVVYDYRFENVHLESLSNYNDIILFGFKWSFRNI